MSIYWTISNPLRRRVRINLKDIRRICEDICASRAHYINHPAELKALLEKLYAPINENLDNADEINIETIFSKVFSYLKLDEKTIKELVLQKIIDAEFGPQVGHVNHKTRASSTVLELHGEKSIEVEIYDSNHINVVNSVDIYSNIAYIEDPFALDELNNDYSLIGIRQENHRGKLLEMLAQERKSSIVRNVMDEMVISEKLTLIFNMLNEICEGDLARPLDKYVYSSSQYKSPLPLSSISTGLKTFLVLKTLLMNGAIEEGGTIILDEPEIHLHPEWQLIFAELIVLIQKEFGIHILLTTHSPYFLRALQVYSAKHRVSDSCKYYLSGTKEDVAHIIDVTNNIEQIYAKLSRPLQHLEDTRWLHD